MHYTIGGRVVRGWGCRVFFGGRHGMAQGGRGAGVFRGMPYNTGGGVGGAGSVVRGWGVVEGGGAAAWKGAG